MKKIFLTLFVFSIIFLNAQDSMFLKQRNVLYIQNMIKIEEKIAKEFEKYLLTEFKIPTFVDLIDDAYLGANFSTDNLLGNSISFQNELDLKININIKEKQESYIKALYERDLYRDNTSVFLTLDVDDTVELANSYVLIDLKSDEAKTIHKILKTLALINKDCSGTITSRYCNHNDNTIRWYDASSNWIEYDKKDFESGNVTIQFESLLSDVKLDNLAAGSYIFVQNGPKYLKVTDTEMKVE